MTEPLSLVSTHPGKAVPGDFEAAAALFRPIFARIAEGAVAREHERRLPFEEVAWLKQQRFGALRIPVEFGGYGLDHAGFLRLLIELAAADSNVAHLFRGHIAIVEDRLSDADPQSRAIWLGRFGQGDIIGNASTEPDGAILDKRSTRLHQVDGQWQLNGTKFYTTGSIFADWIDVSARRSDEAHVSALAARHHPGITISDDWDGFGQKLTGTGTGVFANVPVEPHAIRTREERAPYLTAIYQVVLLATLAGIARAIVTDTAAQLRARTRVYSHGNSDLAKDDPQLKQVVGELGAAAYAAEALVLATAPGFAAAQAATVGADREAAVAAAQALEIEVNQAQVAIADIVLRSASRLFDALGASAVRHETALDRHWRNARTILSHNPLVYRARIVGDYLVNGKLPDRVWSVGIAERPIKEAAE
ncbi:monooxygenase [Bosea sp. 685]|uniref:monooxygenase n=1 Tax=Bosea sp. 685 TaxID=3080057 RepID=UPI002892BD47|nr:monooxygenase [Bosea sp. 685]WNJ93799.1 monooxygenase [Bosea sp. 685]